MNRLNMNPNDLETAGSYGAVVASNRAARTVLQKLAIFVKEEAERWSARMP